MIAFGTKGDDGINEGIHLRWAFNDKLGFPPCFKVYRRESSLKDKYEFPVYSDNIPSTIDIPFTFQPKPNDKFKFRLDSVKNNGQKKDSLKLKYVDLEDGSSLRVMQVDGEITFLFSKPISRMELIFVIEASSDFKIKMLAQEDNYYPYHITNENTGLQNLSFDTEGATGIVLRGTGIQLYWLAAWICKKGTGWTQINEKCGCGLPVNQDGTPYVNDAYPPTIGRDLATALCRMGYENVVSSPITRLQFLELKAMLLTLLDEGSEVPVGWTLFPNDGDALEEDGEAQASETLEFSKYDFLLTQSLQVFFAQILDLYLIDTDASTGEIYDYKVTAEWPEDNKRRLDHEITFEEYEVGEELFQQIQLDDHVVLTTLSKPEIVEARYELFRTTRGALISSENTPTVISFLHPVTEVQIVLVNPDYSVGNEIVIEAFKHSFSVAIDRQELAEDGAMLRVRAEQIDYIKIHAAQAIICRLHYDFENYPKGLQEYVVCGVFKHTHLPLSTPTELTASMLPGGTHNDQDGNITQKPYMAGLHWEVNENPKRELISIASVLYHIEKRPHGGAFELLTEKAPLFVAPASVEEDERNTPIGWPKERQYFMDTISLETQNDYRISALDLFGRQSAFTDSETYEITIPKPPHPTDVRAKFLDYSTYEPAEDTFKDSTINIADQTWLRTNGRNAIVVRWTWPANLQLQAPDVSSFRVHYGPGWLNTYTGTITTEPSEETLAKSSLNLSVKELAKYEILDTSAADIETHRFEIILDQNLPLQVGSLPDDAFRLCWLTQGNHSFLILKNTGMQLWALKVNDIPLKDRGFGIAVTSGNDFFINYRNPDQWTDSSIVYDKRRIGTGEEYIVYIENPAFPDPVIQATDTNKVRYGQIGVSSLTDQQRGSVSPASTIMALYWDAPPRPAVFMPTGDQIMALKASPANIHGKSTFTLDWNDTGAGLKYHIYRALDETLFKVDNAQRPNRSNNIYTDFKSDYDFEDADVDVIQNIPHEPDPILVGSHYKDLTPGQLQVLACLPDNVEAYSKINEGTVEENAVMYLDKTLNGQSNNCYFYALSAVDTNGLQGELSLATPPVEIPKTTPPPVPVITSVNGGDNRVTVKWAKNPGADIAGYLVYRTQDPKKARDSRKMQLIKANDTDIFTVAVNGMPTREFDFADESAIARQAYYYGVVAVGLSDEGKWLPSRVSKAVVGQAYDVTPPEPPVWDEENSGWVYVDEKDVIYEWEGDLTAALNPVPAVRLVWSSTEESMCCTVQRRLLGGGIWKVISAQTTASSSPLEFEFLDKTATPGIGYDYQVIGEDLSGNKSSTSKIHSVWP